MTKALGEAFDEALADPKPAVEAEPKVESCLLRNLILTRPRPCRQAGLSGIPPGRQAVSAVSVVYDVPTVSGVTGVCNCTGLVAGRSSIAINHRRSRRLSRRATWLGNQPVKP